MPLDHHKAFTAWLVEKYRAVYLQESGPFLVVGCNELPSANERPFSIAGCVVVWQQNDPYPFMPFIGHWGRSPRIEVLQEIRSQLITRQAPSDEVILWLAENISPDCMAISVFWEQLVIELSPKDRDEHAKRMALLPSSIGCRFGLLFRNGPPPQTTRKEVQLAMRPERAGANDIALAQLHDGMASEKKLIISKDAPCKAKKLMRSTDCNIGDEYLMDSFASGSRLVRALGVCYVFQPRSAQHHELPSTTITKPPSALPTPSVYIHLRQVIGMVQTCEDKHIPSLPDNS